MLEIYNEYNVKILNEDGIIIFDFFFWFKFRCVFVRYFI